MDMGTRGLGVLAALAMTVLPSGVDGQKTPVRVEFRLVEPNYVALFSVEERSRLEADAATMIAEALGDRLPILSLSARDSAAYVLRIELDRRGGAGANELQADRGLIARLIGPDGTSEPTWWGLFREASAVGGGFDAGDGSLPPDRLFLDLIRIAVDRADVNALVRDQLSEVPIADEGRVWTPPPGQFGWVAPLERQQLCLAEGTSLLIQVLVPSPFDPDPSPRTFQALVESDFDAERAFGGTVPPHYQGFEHGVFTRPDPPDQSGLDQLLASDSVRVQRIFLLHFQRDPQICQRPLDPLAAEAESGGAP
jgi:hypothetical protein